MSHSSRRKFLQKIGATGLVAASTAFPTVSRARAEERMLRYDRRFSANDTVRVGVIGYGIQGHFDLRAALQVPGVELAAICDLYTGRTEKAREDYGKDIFITRDYRELLQRDDIDAVIIASHDCWHAKHTLDALAAGKHVYVEKPMVYSVEEGHEVMRAARKSDRVLQVGSQRVSSIAYVKAKELLAAGEIGDLNMVNAVYDRQSSIGAWQYSIPPDANAKTTDWDEFIRVTEKMPFDAKKFFWWRAFHEVGTGVAGDLFIHLLSGVHFITNSLGPESIYSTGQFSYWNDGRNMPDVMSGVMQYPDSDAHPAFQLTLRTNFIAGTGGGAVTEFIGSEGTIDIGWTTVTVKRSLMPEAPGFGGYDSVFTFPEKMQGKMERAYQKQWTEAQRTAPKKDDIVFKLPEGYSDHVDHFTNFFDGIREGKPVVEDAEFGFRAVVPALACNESYFEKKVVRWDPKAMKMG